MSFFRTFSLILAFVLAMPTVSPANAPLDTVQELLVNGQADAAIQALRTSLSSNPSGAAEHNLLCRIHYAEERWDNAVSECERAANLNPSSSLNQLWLGRAYGEKAEHSSWFTAIGLAKKTRIAFEKAIELDSNNIEARSDLSEYYIEAPGFLGGGTDKAAAQANVIEKVEPGTSYWIRARIAEHDKRNSDAEQHYKKALQLDPGPRRIFDLASFYRRVNRLDDLEAAIQQSAKLNTKNDSALFDSASLLLRVNRNLPLAATLLQRYINQGEKSEDAPLFRAHYVLGQILERMGDTPGAKKAYQIASANASEFAPANAALKKLGR